MRLYAARRRITGGYEQRAGRGFVEARNVAGAGSSTVFRREMNEETHAEEDSRAARRNAAERCSLPIARRENFPAVAGKSVSLDTKRFFSLSVRANGRRRKEGRKEDTLQG